MGRQCFSRENDRPRKRLRETVSWRRFTGNSGKIAAHRFGLFLEPEVQYTSSKTYEAPSDLPFCCTVLLRFPRRSNKEVIIERKG